MSSFDHCALFFAQVTRMLTEGLVTTQAGTVHIGHDVSEVSICVHSDTPVSLVLD